MASIISARDLDTGGYAVRPVSFRGQPVGPEYRVVKVGNLAKLRPEYVDYILGVDLADLVRRFTRHYWVAFQADGSVAFCDTTKRDLAAAILAAHS
jgi:hypothetical protein